MSAIIKGGGGDLFGPAVAVDGNIPVFNGTSGKIIKDGKAAPAGTIVGDTDTQTLSNKTLRTNGINFLPSGLLVSNHSVVTQTSVGATTVWSVNIPANLMSKVGDALRLTSFWNVQGIAGSARSFIIYLDGAILTRVDYTAGTALNWILNYIFARTGATTINIIHWRGINTGSMDVILEAPTWDHSISHTLRVDVYISAGSGYVSRHYGSVLEFLPLI